jgi:hypothetical protein
MLLLVALIAFFTLTGLKDFGVVFKYWDLLRGVACAVAVLALILGRPAGI